MARVGQLGQVTITSASLREYIASRFDRWADEWRPRGGATQQDTDAEVARLRARADMWRSDEVVCTQFADIPAEVHVRFGRTRLDRVWDGVWDSVEVDGAGRVRRSGSDEWVTL